MDRRVRQPGVRHHRSQSLGPDDVASVDGIPVTTVARTLMDVSGVVGASALGRIVDEAIRRDLVGLDPLRSCHARFLHGSGRDGHAAMEAVLAERIPGYRAGGSERELDVDRTLRAAGLPPTVRQHEVTIDEQTFRLDHAYPDRRIAFEFDGWAHHRTYTAFHDDRRRWRRLTAAGWTIVSVTAATSPEELVADTRRVIGRLTLPSSA